MIKKRDFDKEAAAWDTPQRLRLAGDIFSALEREIPLSAGMDAVDFGCGTGLLALALAPRVKSVTGVDSSRGMLEVLDGKIERLGLTNARTRWMDLEGGDRLPGPCHLLVSAMALHHVPDVAALLAAFRGALRPGGHLALADLEAEDGSFHGDNTGVFHFGFEREALRRLAAGAGFVDVRDRPASDIEKPGPDGRLRKYPVFLLAARAPEP